MCPISTAPVRNASSAPEKLACSLLIRRCASKFAVVPVVSCLLVGPFSFGVFCAGRLIGTVAFTRLLHSLPPDFWVCAACFSAYSVKGSVVRLWSSGRRVVSDSSVSIGLFASVA